MRVPTRAGFQRAFLCLFVAILAGYAPTFADLDNGSFDAGLDSWDIGQEGGGVLPGTVEVINGAAQLTEGDSFLTTLSQPIVIPSGMRSLSFDVFFDPGLDNTDAFVLDAFEASLLEPQQNQSLVTPWRSLATSFFNVSEDGTISFGPEVEFDGQTVTVDLSSVAEDQQAVLYFDLVGGDNDVDSSVRIDNVVLMGGNEPPIATLAARTRPNAKARRRPSQSTETARPIRTATNSPTPGRARSSGGKRQARCRLSSSRSGRARRSR